MALEIDGLTLGIQQDHGTFQPLLEDISLSVGSGQAVGLVGEAGSGKSLLVHAIAGLLRYPLVARSGAIRYDGQDLLKMDFDERRQILGKKLAIVLSGGRARLNPLEKAGKQIARVRLDHNPGVKKEAAYQRAVELLGRVGIPDPDVRALAYPHELSGGMAQRVLVAMSLANEPQFLVADEPTQGMDVTVARQVLDDFGALIRQEGLGLLIVSRDLGIVANYCDRVAVLHEGRLVETAEVKTFFKSPAHQVSRELLEVTALERSQASEWSDAASKTRWTAAGAGGRGTSGGGHAADE